MMDGCNKLDAPDFIVKHIPEKDHKELAGLMLPDAGAVKVAALVDDYVDHQQTIWRAIASATGNNAENCIRKGGASDYGCIASDCQISRAVNYSHLPSADRKSEIGDMCGDFRAFPQEKLPCVRERPGAQRPVTERKTQKSGQSHFFDMLRRCIRLWMHRLLSLQRSSAVEDYFLLSIFP